jgi:hypothetical protein
MAQAKKAKLAHEKKKQEVQERTLQFTFKSFVEMVTLPSGEEAAVVELDGEGTKGLVSRRYVVADGSGGFKSAHLACPAVYDEAAKKLAVQRYESLARA